MAQKHVDGLTGAVFDSEEDYLNHVSPVTGFTPRDIEHQGEAFIEQSKKALERTGSLTEEKEAELDQALERAREAKVDENLKDALVRRETLTENEAKEAKEKTEAAADEK